MTDTGRCDHCAHATRPGERYCRHCGAVLSWNTPDMAPPENQPFLLIHLPDGTVRKEPLRAAATRVGRAPDSDLVIDHPRVSRLHAIFELREGACWISDAKSSGGTFLNDHPVHDSRKLVSGDTCRLGRLLDDSVTIVYHEEA